MYIYWKGMGPKAETKLLIDNTDELIEELRRRVLDLEEKVNIVVAKLKQHFEPDTT